MGSACCISKRARRLGAPSSLDSDAWADACWGAFLIAGYWCVDRLGDGISLDRAPFEAWDCMRGC